MSEIDEILDYFEYINQQKRSVSLVSSYHGVSISLEVIIQQIIRRRREVSVTAHYGHNMSLFPATQILIHSDLFPKPVQAKVASVDVHHRSAVLRNFSYQQTDQESRKGTRVQPKGELSASVAIDDQSKYTGRISDISIEGISLILKYKEIDLTQVFRQNTSVSVFLSLPISNQLDPEDISIAARVSNIHAINPEGEFRVGFMTSPLERQKAVLRRYIFDRQTEMFSNVGQDSSPQQSSSIVT